MPPSQSSRVAQSHAGSDSTNPASLTFSSPSSLETDSSHLAVTPIVCPPLLSTTNPPPIISPGPPSPPTQMAVIPNHRIISAEDPSSLSLDVPPPSPVMDANPSHLAVSLVYPPLHNSLVPSITASPVVSLGGLSSPSSDTRMDVDRGLHVSLPRSSIHSSTPSTDSRMGEGPELHVSQLRVGNHPDSTAPSVTPENHPAAAPSSSPTSPPVTPRPARPTRPLVLPRALENIIGQVVSERLDATAASLVEPTVRGIVDACIPRLTDLIDSRLATQSLTPDQSRHATKCKSRANRQPEDSGEGTDGDDEMEGDVFLQTSPRRKKPGPRGKMNRLHLAFRKYLRSRNVIPQDTAGPLPPLAPNDAVQSFDRDSVPPPTLENIAFDWRCSPFKSSRWNREAITILSIDFHNNLRNSVYPDVMYDENTMHLPAILKHCEQKLLRTQQAYRRKIKIDATTAAERDSVVNNLVLKEDRRRKAERMTSRRHGTLARRKKIVLENRSRDPETWDAIHKIIIQLDVEGMSGDETDSSPKFTPKVLRRLELPWINPAVSQLFRAVESYESALRQENMTEQIGNSSLERRWEVARKDTKSRPVAGLPRNWYNDSWFQALTTGARSMLASSKDVSIPILTPFKSGSAGSSVGSSAVH
ncbi:hypothetical protein HD554DRAFT_2178513 [Boletus coccyginus]|nr:hypothetical protein HD554DRAFT_2178513 [Boletus coccyginus]